MSELERAPEPELKPPGAKEKAEPAGVALVGADLGCATLAAAATAPADSALAALPWLACVLRFPVDTL